jgi:cation:H+ antiporter
MTSLGDAALAGIFVASAVVIWVAGIRLSDATDILAKRLNLGEALGGLIFLAIATSLPEIAIVASAGMSGHLEVATGNILGGVAIQTLVLAFIDRFGMNEEQIPLTYRAASLVLVIEGLLVVAMLVVVVMGTQLSKDLVFLRLTPYGLLLVLVWIGGIALVGRARTSLPWQEKGKPPDAQEMPRGHAQTMVEARATEKGLQTRRAVIELCVGGALTLVSGVLLESSGETLSARHGLSGVIYGATVLAAATALPELSTGLASTKLGDYQLAVSDIFGGNSFMPVLFLLATLLSGAAVLPVARGSDIYLTGLGALLTIVYVAGLIFRPRRRIAGMGIDSFAVVILYVIGIVGLVALPSA